MPNYLLVLTLLFSLVAGAPQAHAAGSDCKPLYGGGSTKEDSCGKQVIQSSAVVPKPFPTLPKSNPTARPAVPQSSTSKPNITKGGLPVMSPAPTKTTPNTGPEMLGLLGLAPAAAMGLYLRKKK